MLRLCLLNAGQLGYCAVYNALTLVVLPLAVRKASEHRAAALLGQALVFVALCDALGLAVGWASDRCAHSRCGRRLPFIVGGAAAVVALLVALVAAERWAPPSSPLPLALVLLVFVSLSVCFAALNAVVPDAVAPSSRGTASMFGAINSAVGSALGVGLFAISAPTAVPVLGIAALFAVSTALTCFSLGDAPTASAASGVVDARPRRSPQQNEGNWLRRLMRSYGVDVKRHPDFVLCMLVRVVSSMSNSAMGFINFWLTDVGHMSTEEAQHATATVGALFTVGVVLAAPAARYGERHGKIKAPYLLGIGLTAVAMVLPVIWFDRRTLGLLALALGFPMGIFTASELPVAYAVIPSSRDTAKSLSALTLAFTIGAVLGQELFSLILQSFAVEGQKSRYELRGYDTLFLFSAGIRCISLVLALFINVERGQASQERNDELGESREEMP